MADDTGGVILISACVAGVCCRYDGEMLPDDELVREIGGRPFVAVCPEVLGGLPTPRTRSFFSRGDGHAALDGKARLVNEDDEDVTEQYVKGARLTLEIAELLGVRLAVMKENSPSCGSRRTSRGGRRVPGMGITSALLARAGIRVCNESEARELLK